MKAAPEKMRIDKWLWAVRIFKTRSLAADACEKGKILMDDVPVKASRMIKGGETIEVRKGAFRLNFKILQLSENRMTAKLVPEFCSDCTPAEELEKIKLHALAVRTYRSHGEGRPTKKERRALDDFLDW
ncbi:MAG: Heat shock protein 15 [Bacteroidia bacterium]|nr:MAG: putative heat shock protein 15 [Bacteroidetes bacterium OLB10]MBV6453648.1 Heat shock protein 15 [Bacteroidia bacterium]MBX3105129.1 RNA-binding S4 domain-containing protein [Bacteroidota bacterium]